MKALFFDDEGKMYHQYGLDDDTDFDGEILTDTFVKLRPKDNPEKQYNCLFMTDDLYNQITNRKFKKYMTNEDKLFVDCYINARYYTHWRTKLKRWFHDVCTIVWYAIIRNQKVYKIEDFDYVFKKVEKEYKKFRKESLKADKQELSAATKCSTAIKKTKHKRAKTNELFKKPKDK